MHAMTDSATQLYDLATAMLVRMYGPTSSQVHTARATILRRESSHIYFVVCLTCRCGCRKQDLDQHRCLRPRRRHQHREMHREISNLRFVPTNIFVRVKFLVR